MAEKLTLTSSLQDIGERSEYLNSILDGTHPDVAGKPKDDPAVLKLQNEARDEIPSLVYIKATLMRSDRGKEHYEFANDMLAIMEIVNALDKKHPKLEVFNKLKNVTTEVNKANKSPMMKMFYALHEDKQNDFQNRTVLALDTKEFWDAFRELYYLASREAFNNERLVHNPTNNKDEPQVAFTESEYETEFESRMADQKLARAQLKTDIIKSIQKVKPGLSEAQIEHIGRILDEDGFGGAVDSFFKSLPSDPMGKGKTRSYDRFQKMLGGLNNERTFLANANLVRYLTDTKGVNLGMEALSRLVVETGGKKMKLEIASDLHYNLASNGMMAANSGLGVISPMGAVVTKQADLIKQREQEEKARNKADSKAC